MEINAGSFDCDGVFLEHVVAFFLRSFDILQPDIMYSRLFYVLFQVFYLDIQLVQLYCCSVPFLYLRHVSGLFLNFCV